VLADDDATVLATSGIRKSYRRGVWPLRRRNPVVRGADLILQRGEVVGLVGENGSSKSTLTKILLARYSAGSVRVHRVPARAGYSRSRIFSSVLTSSAWVRSIVAARALASVLTPLAFSSRAIWIAPL
jgi:ABC-type glutathione transport system ATPase component